MTNKIRIDDTTWEMHSDAGEVLARITKKSAWWRARVTRTDLRKDGGTMLRGTWRMRAETWRAVSRWLERNHSTLGKPKTKAQLIARAIGDRIEQHAFRLPIEEVEKFLLEEVVNDWSYDLDSIEGCSALCMRNLLAEVLGGFCTDFGVAGSRKVTTAEDIAAAILVGLEDKDDEEAWQTLEYGLVALREAGVQLDGTIT